MKKKNIYIAISIIVIAIVAVASIYFKKDKPTSLLGPSPSVNSLDIKVEVSPTSTPNAAKPSRVLTKEEIVYTKRKEQAQEVIKRFSSEKNYAAAKTAYQLALQSDPANPLSAATYAELSSLLVIMKDYDSALLAIQKSTQLRPDVVSHWTDYISLELNHFKISHVQIQNIYKDGIDKSGGQYDLVKAYAIYLEKNMDLSGALYQWRDLATRYPSNQEAATNVARLEDLIK
ncbi:MAG: hypothetical protein UW46_C0016G0003 [Candidatus Yanofskybacteria bacterium GW2011_GWF1_44_227]|nr:MAG: hypothetical protein UW46_C0016G0003 [Candidatus Yanofskybacteria bacterium GW2011_GWF1_44_227]